MIVSGPLAVAAVGGDLAADLLQQHSAAGVRAPRAASEFGQRAARDVERQRFADQVRVGAEVIRQIPLDVRQLSIERDQQIDQPRPRVVGVGVGEQVDRPEPGNRSECHFEHAGPVDADQRRVGISPAGEFREEPRAIPRVARQPVGPSERDPVLMTVQLPDDLVIAARRLEVRDGRPERLRRTAAVDAVQVPVRKCGRRVLGAEPQPPVPEQIVVTGDDTIRALGGVSRGVGEFASDALDQRRLGPGGDRKPPRRPPEVSRQLALCLIPAMTLQRGTHLRQFGVRRECRPQIGARPARRCAPGTGAVQQRAPSRRSAPGDFRGLHSRELRESASHHDGRRGAAGLSVHSPTSGSAAANRIDPRRNSMRNEDEDAASIWSTSVRARSRTSSGHEVSDTSDTRTVDASTWASVCQARNRHSA